MRVRRHPKAPSAASTSTGHRRPLVILALALLLCALGLITAASAGATKVSYFNFGSTGTLGGQFSGPTLGLSGVSGVGDVATNENGTGGASAGDVYAVDRGNNRIEQFTKAGAFVRAWGADVAGNGNESQSVFISATGGEYTLTFNGQTTAALLSNATAATLQGALEALGSVGAGNVTVTGGGAQGCRTSACLITFVGTLAASNQPQITGNSALLTGGEKTAKVTNLAEGFAGPDPYNANEIQAVMVNATAGQFKLTFGASTTSDLPFNATPAEVQAALNGLASISTGGGSVRVAGGPGNAAGTTPYLVTFNGGPLAGTDVAQMTSAAGTTPLSGGSGVGENAATLSTFAPGGGAGVGFEICEAATKCKAGATTPTGGGMNTPQGIAIDQQTGNVYVTDQGYLRVEEFSARGDFIRSWGQDVIATGSPHNVGTANFEICTAADVCQTGKAAATGGAFGGNGVTSFFTGYLALAPSGAPNGGDVLVADPINLRVQEFSPSGAFVRAFGFDVSTAAGTGFEVCALATECKVGVTGSGNGQFSNSVNRVAEDQNGNIYTVEPATNFRVQKFTLPANVITPQGAFNPAIGGGEFLSGASAANTPTDVAIGLASHVFVAKAFPTGTGTPPAEAAERRVLEFDAAGTELLDTHMANRVVNSVNGLALDASTGHPASGRMYVSSTTGDQRVYVFLDPFNHAPIALTGASGPGANSRLIALQGTVDPEEFKLSDCRFEYGATTAYGASVPCSPGATELGEGASPLAVTGEVELEQLPPSTTYHYRLVASNVSATSKGEDRTFTTAPAPPDSCKNASIRDTQPLGAILLPDCMTLEMVSPPEKASHPAKAPALSADGERALFRSGANLADTPGVINPTGDLYVAARGEGGWSPIAATTPSIGLIQGWGTQPEAKSFSPDFSSWFQMASTPTQYRLGASTVYEGGVGGSFLSVSPLLSPLIPGDEKVVSKSALQGASADHSRFYFRPGENAGLLLGDPQPAGAGADGNTYVAGLDTVGQPSLELLARDRAGKVWGGNCGSRLGGIGSPGTGVGARNQGAISPDGSRVYFSARPTQPVSGECSEANKLRILQRLETNEGPWIGALFSSECSRISPEPACSANDGDDLYQGASSDGSKVYFTTNRQLANSDQDGGGAPSACVAASPGLLGGCDLYLYDSSRPAGQRLVQVSAGETVGGHEAGKEAKVLNGTTAISADGSHVYFVAEGVLTGENAEHKSPAAGKPNLYLYETDDPANPGHSKLAFVGTLNAGDKASGVGDLDPGLWGGPGTFRNQAYPVPANGDGRVLVFSSQASLTAGDVDGGRLDVFRYDSVTGQTQCLSCRPGGPDGEAVDVIQGGSNAVPGTDLTERGRWASDDGNTVVFVTAESLLSGDVNGIRDTYLWRDGQLYRLPGTARTGLIAAEAAAQGENAPVVSSGGSEVAFESAALLLPQDDDGVPDVYLARVDGGFPTPPVLPTPCQVDESRPGEACRAKQSPPSAQGAGSAAIVGPGNPKKAPDRQGRCNPPKHRVKHKGRVRCVKSKHAHGNHRQKVNADRRAAR